MPIPFQIQVIPNRIIRADFFPAQREPLGTLIICHGFKGFKDWGFFPHAAQTLASDLNVITFNFSHNGVGEDLTQFTELEKFAKNTYSRELEDLHTLVTAVKNTSLPLNGDVKQIAEPLFLLGHSRGGGVSLIYAFDHPESIAGVISWNGITNVDLFSDEQKKEMRETGRSYVVNARTGQQLPLDKEILDDIEANHDRFNIIERAKTATVPIILIQGTEDHQRLLVGSERLVQANPHIRWVKIDGGNHTFNAVHPFAGETKQLSEALRHTQEAIRAMLKGAK
jgi:pimeloyl-ACP methyl ester carboxylesterase